MTREKTARLIPNAIQVCTSAEKVYCVGREQSFFHLLINTYLITVHLFISSPTVLLHFLLGKREKLPGCFPHVAKHTVGQGKALLHFAAVTLYSLLTTDTRPCGSNHCSHRFYNSPCFIHLSDMWQDKPCPQDLQSYHMYHKQRRLCCCPISRLTKCLPAGLWLYPILQHLSNRSRVHIKLPRPQTVFLWGYQCCSAIACGVKICTQQSNTFVYCSILRYCVWNNLPACTSGT